MMDRDTVQSEENQAGLREREIRLAKMLLEDVGVAMKRAEDLWRRSIALSDDFGEVRDMLSDVMDRIEDAIEGDR
jgi:hypothetical protein